jgi:hypothetical protein
MPSPGYVRTASQSRKAELMAMSERARDVDNESILSVLFAQLPRLLACMHPYILWVGSGGASHSSSHGIGVSDECGTACCYVA